MTETMSVHSQFIRTAMKAPFLEKDEEVALAKAWRENNDTKALSKLTTAHMRLVIAIAARFKNYGLPVADLIQEGHIGLMETAARFETDRDVRFSTYAAWWIRASVQDYILKNWSIVRGGTSSAQKALFFNLRRLRAQLAKNGEDSLSDEARVTIAETVGVSTKDVIMMEARFSAPDASLNMPVSDSDSGVSVEKMDLIMDNGPLPDEIVCEIIDGTRRTSWLQSALRVLNEREMHIVQARRLDDEQETLEHLGIRLGISKERVRQIESRAMEKLRKALDTQHPGAVAA